MTNTGQSGYGATVKFTYGTSSTTAAIAQITKIAMTGGTLGKIDISTMSGGTAKAKEYISGMTDTGTLSFDVNFDAAQNTTWLPLVGTSGTWLVMFADHTTPTSASRFSSAGYLEPFGFECPMDGAPITQTLNVALSGAVTFTAKT